MSIRVSFAPRVLCMCMYVYVCMYVYITTFQFFNGLSMKPVRAYCINSYGFQQQEFLSVSRTIEITFTIFTIDA